LFSMIFLSFRAFCCFNPDYLLNRSKLVKLIRISEDLLYHHPVCAWVTVRFVDEATLRFIQSLQTTYSFGLQFQAQPVSKWAHNYYVRRSCTCAVRAGLRTR
jgi:hypothetical protein